MLVQLIALKHVMWSKWRPTTTKWHLREFDRYLLFLVVCSIAKGNTVDFSDPLRKTKLNVQTQSVLSGTAETQE